MTKITDNNGIPKDQIPTSSNSDSTISITNATKTTVDHSVINNRIASIVRNIFLVLAALCFLGGGVSLVIYLFIVSNASWKIAFGSFTIIGIGCFVVGVIAHGVCLYNKPIPVVEKKDVTKLISPQVQTKVQNILKTKTLNQQVETKEESIRKKELEKKELLKKKKEFEEEKKIRSDQHNNDKMLIKIIIQDQQNSLNRLLKQTYEELIKIENQLNNPITNQVIKILDPLNLTGKINNAIKNTDEFQPTDQNLTQKIKEIKSRATTQEIKNKISEFESKKEQLIKKLEEFQETALKMEKEYNSKDSESDQRVIELKNKLIIIEKDLTALNGEKENLQNELGGLEKPEGTKEGRTDEEIQKSSLEKLPPTELRKVFYETLQNREKNSFFNKVMTPAIHWFFKDLGKEKEAKVWLESCAALADAWKAEFDAKDEDVSNGEHSFFIKVVLFPITRLQDLKKEISFKEIVDTLAEKELDFSSIIAELDIIIQCNEKSVKQQKIAKEKFDAILSGKLDFSKIPKESHFLIKELLSNLKFLFDKVSGKAEKIEGKEITDPDQLKKATEDGKTCRETIAGYDLTTPSNTLWLASGAKAFANVFVGDEKLSGAIIYLVNKYWVVSSKKVESLKDDLNILKKELIEEEKKENNALKVLEIKFQIEETEEHLKYEEARFQFSSNNKKLIIDTALKRHKLAGYFHILKAVIDFYVILRDYCKDWESIQKDEKKDQLQVAYLKKFAAQMQVILNHGTPAIHQLAQELKSKFPTCIEKCDKFVKEAEIPTDYSVLKLGQWLETSIEKANATETIN